jgi:hypothetical protein
MKPRMVRKERNIEPAEVVVSAYEAANHGRLARANGFLAPALRRTLRETHAETIASGKRLRRLLLSLRGRRGEVAARDRKAIRALIASNRVFARMQLGSPGFLHGLWRSATRGRSIVRIRATRQIIRGAQARVYLRLTLGDGTVVKDSEPLVLHQGRWLLG